MEILLLPHWEKHTGKELDANLTFQDGSLKSIFVGRCSENPEGLMQLPTLGTTLEHYLSEVRRYNEQRKTGGHCLIGCPLEDVEEECYLGVHVRSHTLDEVWDDEIEGWDNPFERVIPELVEELFSIYTQVQGGGIVISPTRVRIKPKFPKD